MIEIFYLGVDGGGTKTAFGLVSKTGEVLGSETLGTAHLWQVGAESVRRTLSEGLLAVCQEAAVDPQDISYSVWGLPGFGESLEDTRTQKIMVGEILKHDNYEIVNDSEVGWAGGLACQPGLHLVAGTGAIGFGRDRQGKTARSSGWDEIFGDEGSAYWLGRELLGLFCKQADHRLAKSALYDLLKEHLSLQRDLDLIPIMAEQSGRDDMAQLAKIACQAALSGDVNAIELFERAAWEHSLIISALLQQLDFSGMASVPVSYSGGVFNSGDLVLKPLRAYLEPYHVHLQKPKLSPVLGACLCALDRGGAAWDDTTVATLSRFEGKFSTTP